MDWPRNPLLVPVSIEVEGREQPLEGRVLNASEGGLFVLVYSDQIEVGMSVRVSIAEKPSENRPPFSSVAQVMRVEEVLMAGSDGGATAAYDVGLRLETPFVP